MKDYIHLVLDVALTSEDHFIIIGRNASLDETGDPVLVMIEGYPIEEVISTVEEVIRASHSDII